MYKANKLKINKTFDSEFIALDQIQMVFIKIQCTA